MTMLKGRDHLVAATALQYGLKVTFQPYLFEDCAEFAMGMRLTVDKFRESALGLLDKVADKAQTHIWFESCAQCEGMYFDAGEFSDLKYIPPY